MPKQKQNKNTEKQLQEKVDKQAKEIDLLKLVLKMVRNKKEEKDRNNEQKTLKDLESQLQ